jgi:propanediol dehydratase small subunit
MMENKRADNPAATYPVGEKNPDRVQTRRGHTLGDLTLDNLLAGQVDSTDFGITAEGLRLQAVIAEQAGRPNLAQNLRRGAELVEIPEDVLLGVYELLRPGRAQSMDELLGAAQELRDRYQAHETAALLEEAAMVYERRGIFSRRY